MMPATKEPQMYNGKPIHPNVKIWPLTLSMAKSCVQYNETFNEYDLNKGSAWGDWSWSVCLDVFCSNEMTMYYC